MNYETLARRAEGQSDHYRELAKKARWAGDALGEQEWTEMSRRREARAHELRRMARRQR